MSSDHDGGKNQEAECSCQLLIDAIPYYVLILDGEHRIHASNRVTADAFSMTRGEIIGQYCPRLVHQTDGPFPGCPLEQSVRSGQPATVDIFDDRYGTWVRSSTYPTEMRGPEGQRLYLHFAVDITKEHDNQASLARSLEHHMALGEILKDLQGCDRPEDVFNVLIDRLLSLSWLGLSTSATGFLLRGDRLKMVVHRNVDQELVERCGDLALGECHCGVAAQRAASVYCSGIDHHHTIRFSGMRDHGHAVTPPDPPRRGARRAQPLPARR